jgi:hypothetical protein
VNDPFPLDIFSPRQAKKTMSKNDSKAFNTFAQKLKKNNKDYQADIDRFKQVYCNPISPAFSFLCCIFRFAAANRVDFQNPAAFNKAAVKVAKEEDEDEDDEDENDDDLVAIAKPGKKAAVSDDEEDGGKTLTLRLALLLPATHMSLCPASRDQDHQARPQGCPCPCSGRQDRMD